MEWISINDKLPAQNEDVLTYCPAYEEWDDSILIGYYYFVDEKPIWWCICRQDVGPFYPTYWMYLPDKPKEYYDA